jgi:hypothetical protein
MRTGTMKTTKVSTNVDQREAPYNDRKIGLVYDVQLPVERITTLHGFVIDLDPALLRPGNPLFAPADSPAEFFTNICPMLDRHPILRFAEVRSSGRGIHLLVWIDPPVELCSAAAQIHWDAMVRIVQRSVPSDPTAPGITALTRAVGSINRKNGAVVEVLRPGKSVEPQQIDEYLKQISAAMFKVIVLPLVGDTRVSPCPVCQLGGSRLDILDRAGMCYGGSDKHKLSEVFDSIYAPRVTVERKAARPAIADTQRDAVTAAAADSSGKDTPTVSKRRPKARTASR